MGPLAVFLGIFVILNIFLKTKDASNDQDQHINSRGRGICGQRGGVMEDGEATSRLGILKSLLILTWGWVLEP